ncbi:glucosylceramidase [Vibrio astriarenae]|uniref:Glucosylceramidase n=1 Tax=Vibrio astriarenae TaxID=1481923 RepID=A0A7Z2T0U6_9VIBR|nr:GH116 family glycosyl hydrolase [Vibrio astriarenae]QIA62219.1 glucosylceramidase [Vibrio astriarenae]
MKNTIPYTSYLGDAKRLTSKGDAVEFIQPWYTPISTTPENTGMAFGGIGSTFTLTPNGDTPNFSFIPGIFIDISDQDIHFNDFYTSVAQPISIENIKIKSDGEARSYLNYYPALFSGKEIHQDESSSLLEELKSSLLKGIFYQENQERFSRWNIEFTRRTQQAINQDPTALHTQVLVAVDFFNGLLINSTSQSKQLTAKGTSSVESVRGDEIDYRALYPIAEFDYRSFETVSIKRKAVSPVVKDDAELCSLPSHWNHFELVNNTDQPQSVTIVQPLLNLIGSTYRKGRDGIQDSFCTLTQNPIKQQHQALSLDTDDHLFSGVLMASDSRYGADIEGEVNFGIVTTKELVEQAKVCVTVKPAMYSAHTQREVQNALNTGRTNQHFDKGIYSGREALAGLAVINVELAAHEAIDLRFIQTMEHGKIALGDWETEKAYAQYLTGSQRSTQITQRLIGEFESIEARIVQQQTDFLNKANKQFNDSDKALRFATMAMNTLSFMAESTVWDKENKFLVKECVDYPFFNSLDVYFYGSFALLYLLPELDGFVMEEFARAILAEDDTKRRYWEYEDKPFAELVDSKYEGTRAVRGAVIHDLGSPFDIQPDAYSWHNVKEWKDLAPKFILMVYRHFKKTGNRAVVEACWSAVKESVVYLENLVAEGDTLPLTRGTDDTFDNLSSHGISIYCASLWSAGLRAGSALAELMNEPELSIDYAEKAQAALEELEESLWDEEQGYYHFFVTPVQTKHLTGEGLQELREMGIEASGDKILDKNLINQYLNRRDNPALSKLEERRTKKRSLKQVAPNAFTAEYDAIVELDSDNSFGDALLADSYLQLLGDNGLFPQERVARALDFVCKTNFKANSPKVGVANMTLADGMPHHAFQAQDVWIGVQFSVATALQLADKRDEAEQLMDTTYRALYQYARIPFAAPEGFNASVQVEPSLLVSELGLTLEQAQLWIDALKEDKCLLPDGRVSPSMCQDLGDFQVQMGPTVEKALTEQLFNLLKATGLKYTAGRYFRPGMIFAYNY